MTYEKEVEVHNDKLSKTINELEAELIEAHELNKSLEETIENGFILVNKKRVKEAHQDLRNMMNIDAPAAILDICEFEMVRQIGESSTELRETLKEKYPDHFQGMTNIELIWNGTKEEE